jgi:Domain of unknown function (DUF4397)
MPRWLKILPLALALTALSVCIASCGSTNGPAQVRFVDATQDTTGNAAALDIDVTSGQTTTQEFTAIAFLGVQPNQPGYTSTPSGNDTFKGVLTGTTTQVFSDSLGLGAGGKYTEIATGSYQTDINGNVTSSNIVLLSVPDNVPTPLANGVEFRVIHASPSGPANVDIYIELNPNNGPGLPIAIQGLAYMQASKYVSFTFNPNNVTPPPGFTMYVTTAGSLTPILTEAIDPATAGAARTLVLTDNPGGTQMNAQYLELSDLN